METKVCLQCESTSNDVRAFDNTGKVFCTLKCFQIYYFEHNSNSQNSTHSQLDIKKHLKIKEQAQTFLRALDDCTNDEKLKRIEERIFTLKELQESIRLDLLEMSSARMRIQGSQEAIKTERYRKEGVNNETELKEKKLSFVQKKIVSYRKMKLSDEQVLDFVLAITGGKISREQIKHEMKNL